jgi:hypothetical protein
MSQVIIFRNDDGGVSVCTPTGELPIEAVLAKDVPEGRGAKIVNNTDLPNEHNDFFNAWEMDDDGVVTVSLTKAKELTKARLRLERAPLLTAQDVLYQRAQEANADTTAIVAEKNRLRDITLLADAATTLAALKAISVEA